MNDTVKLILVSAGAFGIALSANIAAKSIYTNSKIGADKKAFLTSAAVGVGITYILMKYYRN